MQKKRYGLAHFGVFSFLALTRKKILTESEARDFVFMELDSICEDRAKAALNSEELKQRIEHLRPMLEKHPEIFLSWMRANRSKRNQKNERNFHSVFLILDPMAEKAERQIQPELFQ